MRNPYFDINIIIDLLLQHEPERADLVEQLRNS